MDIINLGEIIRQIKPSEAVIQQSQNKLINSIQDWKKDAIIFSATTNNKSCKKTLFLFIIIMTSSSTNISNSFYV
jgi:hypothetical protein